MAVTHACWSWAARGNTWMEVDRGSHYNMKVALARRRAAASRLLPDARFIITPLNEPPTEPPDDAPLEVAEIRPSTLPVRCAQFIGAVLQGQQPGTALGSEVSISSPEPFETMIGGAGFILDVDGEKLTVLINPLKADTLMGPVHSIQTYEPRQEGYNSG